MTLHGGKKLLADAGGKVSTTLTLASPTTTLTSFNPGDVFSVTTFYYKTGVAYQQSGNVTISTVMTSSPQAVIGNGTLSVASINPLAVTIICNPPPISKPPALPPYRPPPASKKSNTIVVVIVVIVAIILILALCIWLYKWWQNSNGSSGTTDFVTATVA